MSPFSVLCTSALVLLALSASAGAPAAQVTTLDGPVQLAWETSVDAALGQDDVPAVTARAGSLVIAAGRTGTGATDLSVVAFDTASGSVAWSQVWTGGGQAEGATAIAVAPLQGRVFVGGYSRSDALFGGGVGKAVLVAYDLATGAELWSTLLPGGPSNPSYVEINALALSPDGGALYAAIGPDPDLTEFTFLPPFSGVSLARFAPASGAEVWKSAAELDGVRDLLVSPDGAAVYAAGAVYSGSVEMGIFSTFALQRTSAANGALVYAVHLESGIPGLSGARALAQSADGATLFLGGGAVNEQIQAVSAATGLSAWTLAAPGFTVESLALAPGGSPLVASGTAGGSIRTDAVTSGGAPLWSRLAGSGVQARDLALDPLSQAAYVAGGGYVPLTADAFWYVARLNLATGGLDWETDHAAGDGLTDDLAGIAVAPGSGAVHAVGSRTAQIAGHDVELLSLSAGAGQPLQALFSDHVESASQALVESALGDDGARLYLAGNSGVTIFLGTFQAKQALLAAVDTASASTAWTRSIEPPTPGAITTAAALAVDSGGGRVFAGGGYGSASHYLVALDGASGAELWFEAVGGEAVQDLAIAPHGSVLGVAATSSGSTVLLHGRDAATGALLWTQSVSPMDLNYPPRIVASPDGSRFYLVATNYVSQGSFEDPLVTAVDAATGAVQWAFFHDFTGAQEFWDHDGARDLALSPDGTQLFVTGGSTFNPAFEGAAWTMAVDTATAAVQWAHFESAPGWSGTVGLAQDVAVSPDGKRVYSLAHPTTGFPPHDDWVVVGLDAATGQHEWTSTPLSGGASDAPYALAVDPDGSKVYGVGATNVGAAAADAMTLALDSGTGTLLWSATLASAGGQDDRGRGIAITPDGRLALSASESFAPATKKDFVVQAFELPELTGFPAELSLASGGTHSFDLSGGAEHAGEIAWLLGSFSGTSPGLTSMGFTLPLNPDAYFVLTVNHPNQPPLAGSLGLLDATGHREASLTVPAVTDPSLAGVVVHHAWFALQGLQVSLVSNAVPVTLTP